MKAHVSTSPRPKAFVFDLGKVLLEFDYGLAAAALSRSASVNAAEFRRIIDQSPLLHRFESGAMTARDFFGEICRLTGYRDSFDRFAADFGDIFAEIPPMVSLHRHVRSSSARTFVLSNTNEFAVANVRSKFPFFTGFDGYVFSHEAGAMKPHPSIYEALERLAGSSGSDVLFIDDRPENIEAAANRGWRTILHHSPDETRRVVESALAGEF
jgi:glucose-1-phosphatase